MNDLEVDGKRYQEMNVDGGVVTQSFLHPPNIGLRVKFRSDDRAHEHHAYVIRNRWFEPTWASVNRMFVTICGRAIATMIHHITDIHGIRCRSFLTSRRFRINLARTANNEGNAWACRAGCAQHPNEAAW
jgi:hypothetical protein